MEIPAWHIGHVVRKLMDAHTPPINRGQLAEKAGVQPMTITHLLDGVTKPGDDTLEAIAKVFDRSALDLRVEVERSNAWRSNVVAMPPVSRSPRDRTRQEIEAEHYAHRILHLSTHAQTAIFSIVRAFEEAFDAISNQTRD